MRVVLRTGFACALLGVFSLCSLASASPQLTSDGGTDTQTTATVPTDFEVKIVPSTGILVRRKGTSDWTPSSKISEPIVVGALDGDHKIYLPSKAKSIKAPKRKHTPDPDYPNAERESGDEGRVYLHLVVDDHGTVRLPTVDASSSPEFAQSALEAVKKWTFEPAQLNRQPVAVLITVEVTFRFRR